MNCHKRLFHDGVGLPKPRQGKVLYVDWTKTGVSTESTRPSQYEEPSNFTCNTRDGVSRGSRDEKTERVRKAGQGKYITTAETKRQLITAGRRKQRKKQKIQRTTSAGGARYVKKKSQRKQVPVLNGQNVV